MRLTLEANHSYKEDKTKNCPVLVRKTKVEDIFSETIIKKRTNVKDAG